MTPNKPPDKEQIDIMLELGEIDKLLQTTPLDIENKSIEVVNARKLWQVAKAEYELKFNQILSLEKAKNPDMTQTDLKGSAVQGSHQLRLDMIISESVYRARLTELAGLRDSYDGLKERSWNLRSLIKRFE